MKAGYFKMVLTVFLLFLLFGLFGNTCLLIGIPHTPEMEQPTLYGLKNDLYHIIYIYLCSWMDRERI